MFKLNKKEAEYYLIKIFDFIENGDSKFNGHPGLYFIHTKKELKEKIHTFSNEDEYFFMILPGKPMSLVNIYKNFRRYLEQAGISHTGRGPRVHDFRHTYCVNLLRKWADEGKDLITYLPYMRTILGHEGFEETAYYLKLTAEAFPNVLKQMEELTGYVFPEVGGILYEE